MDRVGQLPSVDVANTNVVEVEDIICSDVPGKLEG